MSGAGCWCGPAQSGTHPIKLGRDEDRVAAIAVLGDGRIVTGGHSFDGGRGRVLVWDPAQAGTDRVELGRDEDGVAAIAVLGDGRIVTGGHRFRGVGGRVLVWDPAQGRHRSDRARPRRGRGGGDRGAE